MKKLILIFLIVFACLALFAQTSPISRNPLKFQDARNYCSDMGMHVATVSQLKLFCSRDSRQTGFWTLDGTIFDISTCLEYKAGNKSVDLAYVFCAKN